MKFVNAEDVAKMRQGGDAVAPGRSALSSASWPERSTASPTLSARWESCARSLRDPDSTESAAEIVLVNCTREIELMTQQGTDDLRPVIVEQSR
ncbi:MAG TPA: hypothetical protein VF432_05580 [Thermoanaerobaculia bacterium]